MPTNPKDLDPLDREDDAEPMTPEHFELTISAMSFQSMVTVQAARAVLVDGRKTGEAATHYGVPQPQVSRAVNRIEQKWQDICAREQWICEPVALPPEAMALVRNLEAKTLEPLKERLLAKKRKRSRRS